MDLKKNIMMVVSLMVAVIIALAVLVPVIEDSSASEDTFTNDGFFRMSHYDDTTNHTVTWTYEKPNIMTVDGEDVTIDCSLSSVTVIADTDFLVRMNLNDNHVAENISYMYSTSGQKIASVADSQTATFTFSAGTVTISCGSFSGSNTYTDIYLPDNDGDLVMKNPSSDSYVLGDSPIVGFGLTRINSYSGTVASPGVGFEFIGTVDDGVTGRVWREATGTTTVSNEKINATAVSSHEDLYNFKSITATATLTETVDTETETTDTALTYNYVIIPYQVTAERSAHVTPIEASLLGIIPLLVVIGIVIGAVWFIRQRN